MKKKRKEGGKDEEVLRKIPFLLSIVGASNPCTFLAIARELGEERYRELLCILFMKGQ